MTTKFIETIGRRKTASARVRLSEASKSAITVNGKDLTAYFQVGELAYLAKAPLAHIAGHFSITAVVKGGGIAAQAENFQTWNISRGL